MALFTSGHSGVVRLFLILGGSIVLWHVGSLHAIDIAPLLAARLCAWVQLFPLFEFINLGAIRILLSYGGYCVNDMDVKNL
jgi:hypothetical protein